MPRWLPNSFTVLRLLLVPVVIRAILAGEDTAALMVFAFAAATDILDGATARHYRLTSQAGAYLDPIADKFLLSGVFLALAAAGHVPWWLVATILGRDLYIVFGAGMLYWFTAIRRFPPSVWGKVSTFVQVVTATVWLARNMQRTPSMDLLASMTVWPCAAFTIWSGIHYTWRSVQLARAD